MTAQEHMPNPEKITVPSPATGQLELSPVRWAFLAPRLTALLADFSKLDAFVSSGSQPAMTADLADEVRRG